MKQFKKILCVVDPEKTADTAIIQSIRIANDQQAEITFISVIRDATLLSKTFLEKIGYAKDITELVENRRSAVEAQISTIAPSMKADILVESGIGFIQIIKCVLKNGHDLVVKCAEDMDWIDRMLGSEDMHLLRKCPCPVLMLKPEQKDSFRSILATVDVNYDFDESDNGNVQAQLNDQVLEYSATVCLPELSELYIGSAWEAYAEDFYRHGAFSHIPKEEVDQYVERTRQECSYRLTKIAEKLDEILGAAAGQYIQPRTCLLKGKPSIEIPMMIEKCAVDLIVMGTVGRVGVAGLIIGNTAESILEQAKCSVLAIKPIGFKSPVE
ncbi:Universal stress protein UspA and related nucleotide-binding protein [Hahella chejuensis KCTC 2396]|uniref:Universal stress protein UspA and related nucleotide-binding protein n=1 Tax=Hahella chejuensis (strain KCTC 2396) TaxID=349521 RepID=Q2S7A1_HAHCH|nr:universal stress protein [Hahella chejuensis]ABC33473.1 Universal stress protein UspA and related nucleotide-binding protein [Hahella chejuensis KCTC 2396]